MHRKALGQEGAGRTSGSYQVVENKETGLERQEEPDVVGGGGALWATWRVPGLVPKNKGNRGEQAGAQQSHRAGRKAQWLRAWSLEPDSLRSNLRSATYL